jgi:ABC-2 type transport system permease protein
MLGRTLGGATVSFLQGIVVLLITLLIGFRPNSLPMLLVAFVFMFLIALMFTALGTAIASRLTDMQAFPLIINFLIMPIFFLSGALFPLSGLPGAVNVITSLNPLTYGVDGVRGALSGVFHFSLVLDLGVIFIVTAIIGAIGTWMFSRIEL